MPACWRRDRDAPRRELQLPRKADLLRAERRARRDPGELVVRSAEVAGAADAAERAPRQERQAELGADVDLRLAAAKARRELVLHGDQGVAEDLLGEPDLVGVGVGDADAPDQAGVVQRP